MSMVCKKFSFSNVGNRSTFLGNIKESIDRAGNAGTSHGWYIDDYEIGDEIFFHSLGEFGNQNLYYSMKYRVIMDYCCHMHVCGQTGYDPGQGYSNQPGRFTEEEPTYGLPGSWDGAGDGHIANYLRTPIKEMYVFVCKQFIAVFWTDEVTLLSLPGTVYPVWRRMFFGAMDSLFPETEQYLNWHDQTLIGRRGWKSSPFMGAQRYNPYWNESSYYTYSYPSNGLLYKCPYDATPKNKEKFLWTGNYSSTGTKVRWHSSINYADGYTYYSYSSQTYNYTGHDYSQFRLCGDYYDSTRFNPAIVKHILHRPIVFLWEYLDVENTFCYPIGYLPYQAVRTSNQLKGNDVISFGLRNFSVYPTFRDGNEFGIALEFIEG